MFERPAPTCKCFDSELSGGQCWLKKFGNLPYGHASHTSSPFVPTNCFIEKIKQSFKLVQEADISPQSLQLRLDLLKDDISGQRYLERKIDTAVPSIDPQIEKIDSETIKFIENQEARKEQLKQDYLHKKNVAVVQIIKEILKKNER